MTDADKQTSVEEDGFLPEDFAFTADLSLCRVARIAGDACAR